MRDRGKHFDPIVLDAFVRFYEREGNKHDKVWTKKEATAEKVEERVEKKPRTAEIASDRKSRSGEESS